MANGNQNQQQEQPGSDAEQAANNQGDTGLDEDTQSAVQDKLMEQAGVVTSESGEVEEFIEEARGDVREAQETQEEATRSKFDRRIQDVREEGERTQENLAESRRGFAQNRSLVQQVKKETEESIRDLEQREEEAVAVGDMQAAQQIRNLTLQQLQFKQQTQQQAFQNMLSAAKLGLQEEQTDIQRERENRLEQQKMADIALQYGVEIRPDDNIDSVINRVQEQGLAGEKRQLELEQMRQSIKESKANIREANRRGSIESLTSEELDALAMTDGAVGEMILNKNFKAGAELAVRRKQLDKSDLKEEALNYDSKAEFITAVDEGEIFPERNFDLNTVTEAANEAFGDEVETEEEDDEGADLGSPGALGLENVKFKDVDDSFLVRLFGSREKLELARESAGRGIFSDISLDDILPGNAEDLDLSSEETRQSIFQRLFDVAEDKEENN